MTADERRSKAIRDFYRVYKEYGQLDNVRHHTRVEMSGDALIEIHRYYGDRKGERILRVTHEEEEGAEVSAEVVAYEQATGQLLYMIKTRREGLEENERRRQEARRWAIEKRRQQAEPERKPLPAGYYNLDCMAALPLFPDKFFDIAVIDAPYGIGADNMAMGTNKARKKNGYPAESTAERVKRGRKESGAGKWDNQVPPPEYFTELFRVSKHCVIWGGNYFNLPPTRGVIVWDKLQPWEAFSQVEIAWTDYDRAAAIVRLSNTGGANTERKIHPTQKPPELYGWLFGHYLQLKRGARFLDTHVGSASSLMAAHDAGLEAWGFEKDAYYYGLSADRLERYKAQYNIFQVAERMEIEL